MIKTYLCVSSSQEAAGQLPQHPREVRLGEDWAELPCCPLARALQPEVGTELGAVQCSSLTGKPWLSDEGQKAAASWFHHSICKDPWWDWLVSGQA